MTRYPHLRTAEPPNLQGASGSCGEGKDNLVNRIRAGEVAAFTELFTTYHQRLCSYAAGRVGSAETAKEIVSDVFLWIWEHRAEWRVTGSMASYLYGAVRNRAINRLQHERIVSRAHAAAQVLEYSPGMAQAPVSPEEELHARELALLVEKTISRLPARSREAFLLQREHGLGYKEIAEVMGISASTVEKHLIRSLKSLREALACWVRP